MTAFANVDRIIRETYPKQMENLGGSNTLPAYCGLVDINAHSGDEPVRTTAGQSSTKRALDGPASQPAPLTAIQSKPSKRFNPGLINGLPDDVRELMTRQSKGAITTPGPTPSPVDDLREAETTHMVGELSANAAKIVHKKRAPAAEDPEISTTKRARLSETGHSTS